MKFVVDDTSVVFVHGLQGHPEHSWTCILKSGQPTSATPVRSTHKIDKLKLWAKQPAKESNATKSNVTYWPRHFVGQDFPSARVVTWGYDSKVSDFFHGPANKNHIFAHSQDLLWDLTGIRRSNVRSKLHAKSFHQVEVKLICLSYRRGNVRWYS